MKEDKWPMWVELIVIGLWKVTYKQQQKNCSFPTCKCGFFFKLILFLQLQTHTIMYPAFSWMLLTSSSWASRCVRARSPFPIDATQAPGHYSTWKSPTSVSGFVSICHFSEFLSPNHCFFDARLSLHGVFSPCRRRVSMRRYGVGWDLLWGSSFALLFCM